MHFVIVLLFIALLIVAAAVVAVVYVLKAVGRGVWWVLFGPRVKPVRQAQFASPAEIRCTDLHCAATNEPHARFCRHCGRPLAARAMRVVA